MKLDIEKWSEMASAAGRGWFGVTLVLTHWATRLHPLTLGTSHWRQIYQNNGSFPHHSSLKDKWQQCLQKALWRISKSLNRSTIQYPSCPWIPSVSVPSEFNEFDCENWPSCIRFYLMSCGESRFRLRVHWDHYSACGAEERSPSLQSMQL